jgi:hypothetical protein
MAFLLLGRPGKRSLRPPIKMFSEIGDTPDIIDKI